MALVNSKKPLNNVTRRFIIDAAGVLDTSLVKSLKMNKSYNCKIISATIKTSKTVFKGQFFGGQFF